MKKLTVTLAALLLSLGAHAEERRGSDLTYCLELSSAQLIARCSGELAGGGKGPTMSRAAVDKLLAAQGARPAPAAQPAVEVQTELPTEK